jgi:hypothetical protein
MVWKMVAKKMKSRKGKKAATAGREQRAVYGVGDQLATEV